jgi:hypothetical protein
MREPSASLASPSVSQFFEQEAKSKAEFRPAIRRPDAGDSASDDSRIGQAAMEERPDEFEVFQAAGGELARHQVVDFEAERRDPPGAQGHQSEPPSFRKGGDLRIDDVDVESVPGGERRTPSEFSIQEAGGFRMGLRVNVALQGEEHFRRRTSARGVNRLGSDQKELVLPGDSPRGSEGHLKFASAHDGVGSIRARIPKARRRRGSTVAVGEPGEYCFRGTRQSRWASVG